MSGLGEMMRKGRRGWPGALAAAAVACAAFTAPEAGAVDLMGDRLELHGFGGAALGLSGQRNSYLFGNPFGSGQSVELALLTTARPADRLTVSGQLVLDTHTGHLEPQLDWAFGEYAFADALRFRAGLVKLPFGLFREYQHVGTLRPFYELPQSVYGHVELGAPAYTGAGLTGRVLGAGWGFEYDAYAGRMNVEEEDPLDLLEGEGLREEPMLVVGGRLGVTTPIDGLRLMVSGYTGRSVEEPHGPEDEILGTGTGMALSAELLSEALTARAEWALAVDEEGEAVNGVYGELAYMLPAGLQPALRLELSRAMVEEDEGPAQFLFHRDIVVGLNYWFSNDFVVKAAYHNVFGNRFAYPAELSQELFDREGVAKRSHLVTIGAQFSF